MQPDPLIQTNTRSKYLKPNTLLLLTANLVTMAFFIIDHGSIIQALWIYWLQSVIIGVVAVMRIMSARLSSTSSDATHDRSWIIALIIKLFLAGAFIFGYGLFHAGYAVFLYAFGKVHTIDMNGTNYPLDLGPHAQLSAVLICGAFFAAHHLISFFVEKCQHSQSDAVLEIGGAMTKPFARILPMHLIIIIGPVISVYVGNDAVFIVFMLLKTLADLRLHMRVKVLGGQLDFQE